jgi:hypothetical protein
MSVRKFVQRSELTARCLRQIGESREGQRLLTPSFNPDAEVRALLHAQERLLNAAERVLERCRRSDAAAPERAALE